MPLPTTSNVTRPTSMGYGLRIGTNYYRLASHVAASQIAATIDEFIAPQTAQNPEDFTADEHSRTFSRASFLGGEGLELAHHPNNPPGNERRYWSAEGVNVRSADRGEAETVELIHRMSSIAAATGSMAYNGTSIFACNGNNVNRIDTPAGTQTTTSEDPHAGQTATTVLDVAALGDEVYVALNTSGIHKRNSAGTWSHWSDVPADRVWGVARRVIAADNDVANAKLYEARRTTAGAVSESRLLLTLPPGERFTSVVHAGHATLVGATDGNIYAFADDGTGTLELKAQTSIEDDHVAAIGYAQGRVFYMSASKQAAQADMRLWRAALAGTYTLAGAQLIREWDDAVTTDLHLGVAVIKGTGEDVFLGLARSGTVSHLWRYDLKYGGLHRDVTIALATAPVRSIILIDGRRFTSDTSWVYREDATDYVTSGEIISPLIDHYTSDEKVWAAVRLFAYEIPANTFVGLYYSTDPAAILDPAHASWTIVDMWTAVDDSEKLITASSRWLALKVRLWSDNVTLTPSIRGFAVRAYPGAGDVQFQFPINTSDQIERFGHSSRTVPGLGKKFYDQLKNLEGTSVTVEFLPTEEIVQGTVLQVVSEVPKDAPAGSSTTTSLVRVKGRRV